MPVYSDDHTVPHPVDAGHTVPHHRPPDTPRPDLGRTVWHAPNSEQTVRHVPVQQKAIPHAAGRTVPHPVHYPVPNPVPVERLAQPVIGPMQIRPGRRSRPAFLLAGAALIVVLLVGVLASGGLALLFASMDGRTLPNVTVQDSWIGPVQVGGLTAAEVAGRVSGLVSSRPITFRDEGRTWTLTAADIGLTVEPTSTTERALTAGRDNMLAGLLNPQVVEPAYTLDIAHAQAALAALSEQATILPGTLQPGRSLNVNATLDRFPPDLRLLLAGGVVDLAMDVTQGPRTVHVVGRGEELNLIAKKYNVAVADIVALNNLSDANTIYPGQELTIPAAGVYVPTDQDAPTAPVSDGKAIVIDLSEQRIYAYENGRLVHSTLTSTGRPGTETVQGDYRIYVKYVSTRMTGPGYDIPNVPYTMYFHQGYGIHGAYWHNSFGRTMSHGCVNLDTGEAKWFFDFAPVGTLVRVIP